MAKARKDSRGYALRTGECERKDGRYSFSYTDRKGDRHIIYGKTLALLRQEEKKLEKYLLDGVDPFAAQKISLNEQFDHYISQKFDLKETTRANYIYMYNRMVRDGFGKRKLASIKYSDIKKFYFELLTERGIKPNTLENVHNAIHPALQLAVMEEVIRINPADGVMGDIKRSKIWATPKRRALNLPQQRALMNFITENNEFAGWVPIITVLLGTGMRIGECLGIRWCDLDFDRRIIDVNHTLSDRPIDRSGKCERHCWEPKTAAGVRKIPMLDEVFDAFLMEYQIQKCLGFCTEEIDGYSGFVFTTANGNVYTQTSVNNALYRIRDCYNKEEQIKAKEENREPVLLPKFSAHILRHTFCTRLCENESNIKVIQTIMGHSDIQTTMDIYADCTEEKKQEIIGNLQGKIFT